MASHSAENSEPSLASLLDDPALEEGKISAQIGGVVLERPAPRVWWLALAAAGTVSMLLPAAVAWLFIRGVGVWGVNIPVGWGFAIVNFVWWIGIGHAGTLISAVLLLTNQHWRNSINRFAEAMTLFAVACAGMFPLLHLGRPQVAYWLFPYPDTMGLWPQWRSPLVWDVFAVSTYGLVSLIFWYIGLIPDLATLRDRARRRPLQIVFGLASLGWRGSAAHWQRYQSAYLLLAALATPLVVSVHSIVGLDFAAGIIPGWHSTIFPPYFVAGAIYSGFAMVFTLTLPIRAVYRLHDYITARHLDLMAKLMLAAGMLVAYGYFSETFFSWYSGNRPERFMMLNRLVGPYWPAYWTLLACNIAIPQLLWLRGVRRSVPALFVLSLVVNLGMWLERYVIVVASLHRDFLPSSWDMYRGTRWDWATFLGTLGFFIVCMLLFVRLLPMISMHEMRDLAHEAREEAHS